MNETVKRDIIDIIARAVGLIRTNSAVELNELSNHTIHNASIYQDEFSISIAVIIYSISKIIGHSREHNGRFIRLLEEAAKWMKKGDLRRYKKATNALIAKISSIDSQFGRFVDDVINHAEIKKGGKIYDHGISLGQAANILGISQWELMDYAGKIKSSDDYYERPDAIERLKFTRGLFR